MQKKVKETIETYELLPKQTRVVVGVSGGMDSIALLHLLHRLQAEADWQIIAVHIHHGLRGQAADEDAAFVEEFCRKLGIACIVRRYAVRREAKARGLGEEECGRELRYAAFREIAGEDGRIAVAHHQKDQAETLLMRLCRGTGLTGLVGMTPLRGNICRPLLFCSREEIEGYCRENGLSWREDASNGQEVYTRNRLRLRVLPLLEEIHPSAVAHIARTASLLAEEEDFLEKMAEEAYQKVSQPAPAGELHLHRESLLALHPALRRRVLRRAMAVFLAQDASFAQVEALEDLLQKPTGKRRNLLGGMQAENQYETLVLSCKKAGVRRGFCHALPKEGTLFIPEADCTLELWISEKKEEIFLDVCTNVFDYDKIDQTLFCRNREVGDFIRLSGGRKKLKALFIDAKIPREERERVPLLAMGQEILWIPFLRKSMACAPDETTKNYLYIRIRRGQA